MKNNELSMEELELVTGGDGSADPAAVRDDVLKSNEDCGFFVAIYTNW